METDEFIGKETISTKLLIRKHQKASESIREKFIKTHRKAERTRKTPRKLGKNKTKKERKRYRNGGQVG